MSSVRLAGCPRRADRRGAACVLPACRSSFCVYISVTAGDFRLKFQTSATVCSLVRLVYMTVIKSGIRARLTPGFSCFHLFLVFFFFFHKRASFVPEREGGREKNRG